MQAACRLHYNSNCIKESATWQNSDASKKKWYYATSDVVIVDLPLCYYVTSGIALVDLLLWYRVTSDVALVDLLLWYHVTSDVIPVDMLLWYHVTSDVALVDFLLWYHVTSNVSLSCGRSRSTRREPPTIVGKQLVNFITCGCESSAPFL
jgi:hypothetical protein